MKTFGLVKGRATFTSITSYIFSSFWNCRFLDLYNIVSDAQAKDLSGSLATCLPVFTWCPCLLDYVIGYLSFNCELMQL